MLVGGKGTRLRPLTLSAPKPLLPTAGVPFLAHQLARAAECGITHVVLATSYRAEMFTEAFGDGAAFGLSIDYVHESSPLGTGGGIRNAAALLRGGPDDPIVVLNGDILSGHDLPAQVDLHRKTGSGGDAAPGPGGRPEPVRLRADRRGGRVTAFLEKTPNPVTNQINAGCYVFRRSVIDQIPAGQVVSVERETFPGLIEADAVVMGYAEDAYWLDVGTPEAFVRGSCDLVLGALPSPAVPHPAGSDPARLGCLARRGHVAGRGRGVPAARHAQAVTRSSAARWRAPLGRQRRCVVTAACSSTAPSSAPAPWSATASSAAARRSRDGAVLDGVVIGDGAYVGPGNELAQGLRLWPGTRLEPTSVRFSSDA